MAEHIIDVDWQFKPIRCILTYPEQTSQKETEIPPTPLLIFTHGASGTLSSGAIANFTAGFARRLPILCFQGNLNLQSRTKMFSAVVENQSFSTSLGGRSMGARAAILAASEQTQHLVLASYPLHTNKDTRDQALLDIDQSVKVVFVSGDHDSMCDLARLEEVRKKMRCLTWRIVVEGADHGMKVKPKHATTEAGKKAGELVAAWLQDSDSIRREGRIFCNEEGKVEWTGWGSEPPIPRAVKEVAPKPKDSLKRPRSEQTSQEADGNVSTRTRKRSKA